MARSSARLKSPLSLVSFTVLLWVFAFPLGAQNTLPRLTKMETNQVSRGASVSFTGENFPKDSESMSLLLDGEKQGSALLVSDDGKSVLFKIPPNTRLGARQVTVSFRLTDDRVIPLAPKSPSDGVLTVVSESGQKSPEIQAVTPRPSYPTTKARVKTYGLSVIGRNFSERGPDNHLFFVGHGPVKVCWKQDQQDVNCLSDTSAAIGQVESSRQLKFERIPARYRTATQIRIGVGDKDSPPFEVQLSSVKRGWPYGIAIGTVAVLFGLVLLILVSFRAKHKVWGRQFNLLTSLFIDKETDTYSLSRFQFYLWTGVAILGYVYMLVSRTLVQGEIEFLDIPEGLPGIVFLSAATTGIAAGVAAAKGPMGAGSVQPSFADFFTHGGAVVPERLQFFIWTILGAAVFLFTVFVQDPGSIEDLPAVPDGFLQLMGISSAGYLGGKLARKSGPVIDEIEVDTEGLKLKVYGRRLSVDAGFRIGEEDLDSQYLGKGEKVKILGRDDVSDDKTLAKCLEIVIDEPKAEWLPKADEDTELELTIINPDGQNAAWPFTVPKQ